MTASANRSPAPTGMHRTAAIWLCAIAQVLQPPPGLVVTPLAELGRQAALAPFNGRFLEHPAGEYRLPQPLPSQALQSRLFRQGIKPSHQSSRLQGPARRFEIHAKRLTGVADQQSLAAVAEADPAQPLIQAGRPAGRAMQGNLGRPKAEHGGQLLPQGCPAVPIALPLTLRQPVTPAPLQG